MTCSRARRPAHRIRRGCAHRRAPAFLGKQPRTSSCAPHSSRLRPSLCTCFPWKAVAHVVLRTAFVAVAQVHVKKVGPPVAVASAMQRGFTSVRPRTVRLSHDLPSCTLAPSDEHGNRAHNLLKLLPLSQRGDFSSGHTEGFSVSSSQSRRASCLFWQPPHQAGPTMLVDPKMFYLDHPIPTRPRAVLRCKGLTFHVKVG